MKNISLILTGLEKAKARVAKHRENAIRLEAIGDYHATKNELQMAYTDAFAHYMEAREIYLKKMSQLSEHIHSRTNFPHWSSITHLEAESCKVGRQMKELRDILEALYKQSIEYVESHREK